MRTALSIPYAYFNCFALEKRQSCVHRVSQAATGGLAPWIGDSANDFTECCRSKSGFPGWRSGRRCRR